MRSRKAKYGNPKKVVARLDPIQWDRLSKAREKYGFSSNYAIIQYLVACFLRVADPEHDELSEPIPEEVKNMFNDYSNDNKDFEFVKPKRGIPQYRLNEMNEQLKIEMI